MAGILNYNKGLYSTQEYRDRLLGRNLPPPVNETLTESGLVSKLEDIGNIINVPINGTASENIQNIYNEEERMFPLGTFYRLTNNVNLNNYVPQNDEYITYELTIPPNLGYPLPEGFGKKVKGSYPFSFIPEKFSLLNTSGNYSVENPLDVVDSFKNLNFTNETSLGLLGGQQLEFNINEKISYVKVQANTDTPSVGNITLPIGDDNGVNNYIDRLRGSGGYASILNNNDVGWNEYNESTKNTSESNLVNNIGGVVRTTSTESRVNTLLEKTSEKQVSFLLDLLNRNIYRPLYEDRRFQGTSNEGSNGNYYIGNETNTNRGSFLTTRFIENQFNDVSGGNNVVGDATTINNEYYWGNNLQISNFNEKTLLAKTKNLADKYSSDVYINQTEKFFKDKKLDRLISRGSGIGVTPNPQLSGDYARSWTVTDNYSYSNAIRNKGLFTSENGTKGFSFTSEKSSLSVLLDNGFPKVHPTIADSETTRKKFMFSIENLAWADNLADLPLSEIGPGDKLTKNKGRIMWFPPYDFTFDETSSANWGKTEFIGRSEPLYTYNNTSRSGSLKFKILVDHPRVINCYRGKSDNLIERFNAGTVSSEAFLSELECSVPQTDLEDIKKLIKDKKNRQFNALSERSLKNLNVLGTGEQKNEFKVTSDIQNQINKFIKETISEKLSEKKVEIVCTGFLDDTYQLSTFNVRAFTTKDGEKFKLFKPGNKIIDLSVENKLTISKQNAKEVYDQIIAGLSSDINIKRVKKKIIGKGVGGGQNKVTIEVNSLGEYDNPELDVQGNLVDKFVPDVIKRIDNLIIDENAYFDFIDNNYPNYFKNISEKITYFQPGFHSITPEGLNNRLTFLNQCMRQGPSVNDSKDNVQPQNLSFGRPPICILRIGDFFHTKIVINTLSISYEPQFDFNSEGIGVQPMVASVTLSIDYVGGNSLFGPINRLQNAVSFNYYANTEVYDLRADTIENGKIKDGIKLSKLKKQLLSEEQFKNYLDDLKEDVPLDQEKDNENTNGDDESSNNALIEIIPGKDGNSVTIKTKSGDKPSEIKIGRNDTSGLDEDADKKKDSKNVIEYKIFSIFRINPEENLFDVDKKENVIEGEEDNKFKSKDEASFDVPIELPKGKNEFLDTEELGKLNEELNKLISERDTLRIQYRNKPFTGIKKKIREKTDEIVKVRKNIAEQKDRKNKIKVVARFSRRPKNTRVEKVFTITEKGLE